MVKQESRLVKLVDINVGEHEVREAGLDEDIPALAASIAAVGLISPLVLEDRDGVLVLVGGHRRYRACCMAGLDEVPAIVRSGDLQDAVAVSFAENFHRRDLSPCEQAAAIVEVLNKNIVTEEQVAAIFHRSVGWVRLQCEMMSWPEDVLSMVHARQLSVAAAGYLARVEDDEYRGTLLIHAVENGVSGRTACSWLQAWRSMVPAGDAVSVVTPCGDCGGGRVPPQSLCMSCAESFAPEGMVPVYLCPACVSLLRRRGLNR